MTRNFAHAASLSALSRARALSLSLSLSDSPSLSRACGVAGVSASPRLNRYVKAGGGMKAGDSGGPWVIEKPHGSRRYYLVGVRQMPTLSGRKFCFRFGRVSFGEGGARMSLFFSSVRHRDCAFIGVACARSFHFTFWDADILIGCVCKSNGLNPNCCPRSAISGAAWLRHCWPALLHPWFP